MNKQAKTIFDRIINELDCGDNSCFFKKSNGMRTNGGCRCSEFLESNENAAKSRQLRKDVIYLLRLLRKEENEA